jgi:hypothetical protein
MMANNELEWNGKRADVHLLMHVVSYVSTCLEALWKPRESSVGTADIKTDIGTRSYRVPVMREDARAS